MKIVFKFKSKIVFKFKSKIIFIFGFEVAVIYRRKNMNIKRGRNNDNYSTEQITI